MKSFIKLPLLLLAATILSITSCHKDKLDPNGLPPATQEGKNTLGFLLNGEPWTPKGFNGTANLSLYYDPGYKEGIFNITAYRIVNDNTNGHFGIWMKDSLNFMAVPFTLSLNNPSLFGIGYSVGSCQYNSTDSDTYASGSLTITKLDTTKGKVIISGKFNAILYKSGCDTIRITDGRFDMSLH